MIYGGIDLFVSMPMQGTLLRKDNIGIVGRYYYRYIITKTTKCVLFFSLKCDNINSIVSYFYDKHMYIYINFFLFTS